MRASFSPTGRHIVCGSEDNFVYFWRTSVDALAFSVRTDRNGMWERLRAHSAVTTAAVFAPRPELIFEQLETNRGHTQTQQTHTSPTSPIVTTNNKQSEANAKSAVASRARASLPRSTTLGESTSMLASSSAFDTLNNPTLTSEQMVQSQSVTGGLSQSQQATTSTAINQSALTASIRRSSKAYSGDVMVTADFSGNIYVFMNRTRVKAGQSSFYGHD